VSRSCKPLDSPRLPRISTRFFLGWKVALVSQELFGDTMGSPQKGHTWLRSWHNTNTNSSNPSQLFLSFSLIPLVWCQKHELEISTSIQSLQKVAVLSTIYLLPQQSDPKGFGAGSLWQRYYIGLGLKFEKLLLVYTSKPINKK